MRILFLACGACGTHSGFLIGAGSRFVCREDGALAGGGVRHV